MPLWVTAKGVVKHIKPVNSHTEFRTPKKAALEALEIIVQRTPLVDYARNHEHFALIKKFIEMST